MKKTILLFFFICSFFLLTNSSTWGVGCGSRCTDTGTLPCTDSQCPYCNIPSRADTGTCTALPTSTPTPPPAGCGNVCSDTLRCTAPCFYCNIPPGRDVGTCTIAPTPTSPAPSPPPSATCDGGKGIPTAIGCINVESPTEFVKSILGLAIGIGGGIAFLLMLFGAFQIMTSQGDPERLKAGKELIGSALAGLLMIIFSVFLLQLIGVQILQIPGLTK